MNSHDQAPPPHPLFQTYESDYDGRRMPAPSENPYESYAPPAPGRSPSSPAYGHDDPRLQGHKRLPDTSRQQQQQKQRSSSFLQALNTKNQIIFLCLIVLQTLVVLAMIALVYATISDASDDSTSDFIASSPKLESIATYLGLFILAALFEILVSLDSLLQKNIMQLALLIPFQIAMVIYSAMLPSQLRSGIAGTYADTDFVQHHVRAYAIVIPSTIGAITIIMNGFTYRLWHEFGWDKFKLLGASLQIKRMYTLYQIFLCLLKFDAFFFVGFSIQFLVLVSGTPTAEFVITIAAVPIILVCLILAAVAVRLESRAGVYTFFVLDAAGMAYFIYKIVRIFDAGDRYASVKKTLTIFSVINFIMLGATFIVAGFCLLNFDLGLKEVIPSHYFGRKATAETEMTGTGVANASGEKYGGGGTPLERNQSRMSID
ncbi:hypothetical protein MNV49_003811 [Pseudohyphozyma bogoriensis]|nr:hypothetical protein MNV49_003811 [Pseudohyphozyma bogoriensis]